MPHRIGRFRVLRLVGSGGMGEVYEAFDDQLQRPVAIKGLLHDRVSLERRERLRREALSAAALSHPAITHVYEIVSEADADWVVMEYVQGRSLADVIASSPLSPGQTANIGVEIAEALAEAHQHGIVHRDIKAENIVLMPSGHVKVLDFGLAKWTGERGAIDDRITTDGMVVGTSRAMSPEQALGRDIDGRSDIFSLGSLLYELASGRPAFRGTTPIETMHKIAGVKYEPLTTVAPGTPEALAAVIERCLARDPSDRYQKAEQVAHELRRVAATATGASVTQPGFRSSQILVRARGHLLTLIGVVAVVTTVAVTGVMLGWFGVKKPLAVAVLPVESPTPGDVAGLASTAIEDAIVTNLARMKNFIVVSGRDVRAVSSQGKRVPEIARELGVRELVETSLTPGQPGQPIRVDLQRLEGSTGRVIWSEQLEVGTDDLMLLQDRIVTALGDAYRGVPTSGHPGSQDATPAALEAYLQAKSRIDSGKYSKDFKEEIALLETAIAEAPRFLAPVTRSPQGTATCTSCIAGPPTGTGAWRWRSAHMSWRPITPGCCELEVWLALDQRDNAAALERARAWTASRPGDSTAWETLAVVLGRMERYREAETAFDRSLALLPSWHTFFSLGQSRESRGDFDGARQAIRRALAISPGNLFLLGLLAEVEMYAGQQHGGGAAVPGPPRAAGHAARPDPPRQLPLLPGQAGGGRHPLPRGGGQRPHRLSRPRQPGGHPARDGPDRARQGELREGAAPMRCRVRPGACAGGPCSRPGRAVSPSSAAGPRRSSPSRRRSRTTPTTPPRCSWRPWSPPWPETPTLPSPGPARPSQRTRRLVWFTGPEFARLA